VKYGKNASNVRCSKTIGKIGTTYDADYKKMVEEYQAKLKNTKLKLLQLLKLLTEIAQRRYKTCKLLISETMLKKIATKKSDIVKPLMEKESFNPKIVKTKDSNMFLMVLLLADGPNLTLDVKKRFRFLELKYFINQLKPLSSILQ
jgi:outer membrane protein